MPTALIAALGGLIPILVPSFVAYLVPKGRGSKLRLPLALITALIVIFVSRMWWTNTAADEEVVTESTTLLAWIVGLPLFGSVAVLFFPRNSPRVLQWATLGFMFAALAVSLPLLRVDMGRTFHFNQDIVWLAKFGIHWHVAVDGISLWLIILTNFTVPIAAYASFGSIHSRMKEWCFSLLLLQAGMLGSFIALDLFLFYVFWELMLVPMYVMIGVWGGTNRIKAAIKFFLYTMFGSVLMLAAILYLAYTYAKLNGGTPSFDFFELQRVLLPRHIQLWLFGAFTLSFVIKVPMFPVHTWLPDAHTEAPTGGSVILAAVMLKLGTYGYLRFCVGLFPEASTELAANLAGVAVLGGIIYGALCAYKQDDVKRLVAYSSVAHLGYVMLGIFAATPASVEGAVLQMINHGISTGALFLLVGVIYDRRHTRQVDEFGGLTKVMPIYAVLFIIATMASVGLPGTNGFVGEFMVITGTFVSTRLGHFNGIQAVGAAIGVILGALYMLSVVQKMFFGPITKPENKKLHDVNHREIIALAPLVIAIFAIGLFPNIFLSRMRGATDRVLGDLQARVEQSPAPRFYQGPIRLLARRPEAPQTAEAAAAEATPPSPPSGLAQ
ncbi:NADH-quinone oxidoreductase subunit M [Pendulispora brunnea]|uniref:NADH-quinone oxidoreductase subunit M n=1 Tax=Pendulispora brunnea TaxID=2905690 RepID=A0ABZ2KIP4_9BACT